MKRPRAVVPTKRPLRIALALIVGVSIMAGAAAEVYAYQHQAVRVSTAHKPVHVQRPVPHAPVAKTAPTVAAEPSPAPPPKVVKSTPTPAPQPVTPAAAAQAVAAVSSAPSSTVTSLTPSSDPSASTTTAPPPTSTTPASPPSSSALAYNSTNWSGYMATTGTFTGVSGSWTVPSPKSTTATSDSLDAAWVGIGGVNSSDLIQIGTDDVVASDGTVTVSAFYELLPANAVFISNMSVNPRDAIHASIVQISAGTWSLKINDITDGQSYSTTLSYVSSLSSAEWIEEDPSYGNGSLTPLDNFGTVNFSSCLATGSGGAQYADVFNPSSITLVSSTGHVLATPSSLTNGSFSVTHS